MISTDDAQALMNGGGTVIAADGTTIGAIGVIYLDAITGDPMWVSALGQPDPGSETAVPLTAASVVGADIRVAFDRQQVDDAPRVISAGHLAPSGEQALRGYYGLGERGQTAPAPGEGQRRGSAGSRAGVMVRSEEQLRVGKETVESGRVRVRKYIVTEDITLTVQVSREELRIEQVPVDDLATTRALPGAEVVEQVLEMTLYAQRPVVTMETVAVEQITVSTRVVTEQVDVVDQVRKERVDADQHARGEDVRPL